MRRRIIAAVVVVLAAGVAAVVVLLHSTTTNCAYPAPVPDLPAQLRSIGGFDQAQDPGDTQSLDTSAITAATALHSDLNGSVATVQANIGSGSSSKPAAVVIPLRGGAQKNIVGLVSFLSDCTGRLYFSAVEDDFRTPLTSFPEPEELAAARVLKSNDLQLTYGTNPFMPEWIDPVSGHTLPARPR